MLPPASTQPDSALLPVAIRRYFEVALYLLVLTGFGTLASTGGLDLVTAVLVGAAILFRGYCLATRRTVLIPENWTTLLTIAYVAFYLADYFLLSRAFLNATVHLVLFVLVVRLFSTRRDRDHYFLAVISFLMVLAASVLTVDTIFLLAFAAFMLMAVATFILMEMWGSSVTATVHAQPDDGTTARKMGVSLAAAAPLFVFFISLGGAAIFFLLPRISSGYLSAYAPGNEISTGFSDRVQLGGIGEIQQSSALVMHIQIDGDLAGALDLKWRGVTLNVFDGTAWSNPHEQHPLPRSAGGFFLLSLRNGNRQVNEVRRGGHTIHYRVLMEPVSSNVFFLAPTPLALEGNYRVVTVDGGGAVFDPDPEHPVATYQATSNIAEPSPADLRAAGQDYPPEILLNYLQLPVLDPRIPPLAQQITSSESNSYDKAVALELYLRSHFGYTLQLPRSVARDPLANFLFERKRGHCEYFASTMAVMLRSLRIPSRVVNGFRTGEFNDVTSQYLIRARDAHSWVEAYFPGYGWVSFDPTPAGPAATHTGWSRSMMYLDALSSFWREWVVNYDVSHQHTLSRQATQSGLDWARRTQRWARHRYAAWLDAARRAQQTASDAPVRWSVTGAVVALLLVLAANLGRLIRAFRRHRLAIHPENSPRAAATLWYEKTLRLLARRGVSKSPAQTPAEFLRSVPEDGVRDALARFTEHYERARFSDSTQDAVRLPELFEEVSTSTRNM
jgi:protein-glutamine gamma-glutamyltransferase